MSNTIIRELLTEEDFLRKVFRKGNSTSARKQAKSAINNLDLYCTSTFHKSKEEIALELKKEYKKNPDTRKTVNFLSGFVDWCLEDHPDLLHLSNNTDIKKPVLAKSKGSIRPYITQIRKYLKDCFAIKLDDDDYRDYVLDYIGPDEEEDDEKGAEPFTPEELFNVLSNSNPRHTRRRVLYYTAKDTAGRISELLQLQKKHFDTSLTYTKIYFPRKIVKWKRRSKTCFLTPETEKLVKPILEKLDKEDFVFRRNEQSLDLARENELRAFRDLMNKLGYDKKRKTGRLIKSFHSIRKFCMKQISLELDETIARDYGGHYDWGKVYFTKSDQEKMETFEKCMPKLCLFEKYEIQPATAQELSSLKQKVDNMENYIYSTRQPMLEQLATNPQLFWKNYRR